MSRLKRVIQNPRKYLSPKHIINNVIGSRLFMIWMRISRFIPSDKLYLKVLYRLAMHKKLDFKNPITYTQKIQWLKLYNTNPLYSKMVDKYEVRKIVAEKIGEEYLIPLLGFWERFEDIDFELLPNEFVLKTTHDSGNVIICKDKNNFDFVSARKTLNSALRINYFYKSREYPYKNATPRIIAEKYMYDEKQTELDDYKFFCFDGVPIFFELTKGKGLNKQRGFFDANLHSMPFTTGEQKTIQPTVSQIPDIKNMFEIASILSKDITHVRIDLYYIWGKVYFGEFTFHHSGGIIRFKPDEWNSKLGKKIKLPFEK